MPLRPKSLLQKLNSLRDSEPFIHYTQTASSGTQKCYCALPAKVPTLLEIRLKVNLFIGVAVLKVRNRIFELQEQTSDEREASHVCESVFHTGSNEHGGVHRKVYKIKTVKTKDGAVTSNTRGKEKEHSCCAGLHRGSLLQLRGRLTLLNTNKPE
jgi:hypothetical protein